MVNSSENNKKYKSKRRYNNKSKRKDFTKNVYVPPSIITYSKIAGTEKQCISIPQTEHKPREPTTLQIQHRYRPKYFRTASYEGWVYEYFEFLIELRNIYRDRIIEFYPEREEYLNSPNFFKKFTNLLYVKSSKEISKYVRCEDRNYNNLDLEYEKLFLF